MKHSYVYDHYYKYAEITDILKKYSEDHPGFTELDSIGGIKTTKANQTGSRTVSSASAGPPGGSDNYGELFCYQRPYLSDKGGKCP